MLSAEIIGALRENHAETDNSVQMIICTIDSLLFSVCCVSLAQLLTICIVVLSIYAKLSSHLLAIGEREIVAVNERNCVYFSKIEYSS